MGNIIQAVFAKNSLPKSSTLETQSEEHTACLMKTVQRTQSLLSRSSKTHALPSTRTRTCIKHAHIHFALNTGDQYDAEIVKYYN